VDDVAAAQPLRGRGPDADDVDAVLGHLARDARDLGGADVESDDDLAGLELGHVLLQSLAKATVTWSGRAPMWNARARSRWSSPSSAQTASKVRSRASRSASESRDGAPAGSASGPSSIDPPQRFALLRAPTKPGLSSAARSAVRSVSAPCASMWSSPIGGRPGPDRQRASASSAAVIVRAISSGSRP